MSLLKNPAHPGDVLAALYLEPLGMSAIALARQLGVPRTRIERLLKHDTGVSADTALRLAAVFGTTPEFWLNLQRAHDLAAARASTDVSGITPLRARSGASWSHIAPSTRRPRGRGCGNVS